MMDTLTQVERLIELAIIQRSELRRLVEELPQLKAHLSEEIERTFEETEPQLRAELEEWTTKQTADKTAALGVALEAKIADLAKSLEVSTQARYNAIIAEREENARLAAQAEAKIAEHAASLPGAVKEIVSAELARFPRAGEIDQLRKEFAEPKSLNPRGKWVAGETYNKLDLVTINGDSYVSNIDGNTEKPSRSAANWTLNAARGNSGGGGGITALNDLLGNPSAGDIVGSEGNNYVRKTLTAGTGITITDDPSTITIDASGAQEMLTATVKNAESVAITRGQVVYLFSATGGFPSVKLAYNTSDATSAKTFGVVSDVSIAPNGTGTITCVGVVSNLNLGAYNDGDTVYLGDTPGSFTATKPYAPNHLVYVGIIERANAGNGELYVRIQNGYELDEIHDVQINSPLLAGQTLIYDATTDLWKNARLTAGVGVSISNGDSAITISADGGVNYQGTWNASTNTPTLTSSVGTKGFYYVVSVAGSTNLNGVTDWKVGDWAIFNGTAWEKVDTTDQVSSVFGRTGAVVGVSTDYSSVGITNTAIGASNPSTGAFTTLSATGNLTVSGTGTHSLAGQVTSTVNAANTANLGSFVASNATLNSFTSYSPSASLDQKYWTWQAGTAVGDGVIRLRALNDAQTNGTNALTITRTGISSTAVEVGGNLTVSGGTITGGTSGLALNPIATSFQRQILFSSSGSGDTFITASSGGVSRTGTPSFNQSLQIETNGTGAGLNIITFAQGAAGTYTEIARFSAARNYLIGTTTDSSNGKLQLATHTTSAGGIGFGTDLSLYRANTGFLILNDASAALDARIGLYNNGIQRGLFEAYNVGTAVYIGAASASWSTIITSGNGTTALTLDSSQNATFANTVSLNRASGSDVTLNLNQVGIAQWSIRNVATSANFSLSVAGNTWLTIGRTTGNFLLGTTTDSGNGRVQLVNHTTSAGGIGFGTDSWLYRESAGLLNLGSGGNAVLKVDGGVGSVQGIIFSKAGTEKARVAVEGSGSNLILYTGAALAALNLSGTDQSAGFIGNVSISKANPELAIRSVSDAAGQIQYLTFGSPTYNRSQFRVTSAGTSDGSIALYTFNAGSPVLSQTWDKDGNATFAGTVSLSTTTDKAGLTVNFPAAVTGSNGPAMTFKSWTNSANLINSGRVAFTITDGSASYGSKLELSVASSGSLTTAFTILQDLSSTASGTLVANKSTTAFRIPNAETPASASATGSVGTITWDASYIYVCTAANTWKRVAIATWP